MFKTHILLFCFLIKTQFIFCQIDMFLGPNNSHEKGIVLYKIVGKEGNGIYSLWINPNGKGGNDEFFLEKHDLTSLNLEYSTPIKFENQDGERTIIEEAYLLNSKIVFVSATTRMKEYTLYAQTFDLSGACTKPIFSFFNTDRERGREFYLSFNLEKENITLLIHDFQDDILSDKVKIFNSNNFSIMEDKSLETTNFKAERNNYYGFIVEKNDMFHFVSANLKLRDEKNKKINKRTVNLHYSKGGSSERKVPILSENEVGYGVVSIYVESENIFVLGGFKFREGKMYSFYTIIDAQDGKTKTTNELLIDNSTDKMQTDNGKKGEENLLDFGCRYVYYNNKTVIVVGEQWNSVVTSSGSAGGVITSHFYDFVVANFNVEKGTANWVNFPKRERIKAGLRKIKSASYLFFIDDKMNVLYLDSPENLKVLEKEEYKAAELEKVTEHNNSTLVIGEISSDGDIKRKTPNVPEAYSFHLRSRVFPNGSDEAGSVLCYRLSKNSFLIYLEEKKIGRWAVIKNF